MTFDKTNFMPMGDVAATTYAGAPRTWSYTTTDAAASVDTAGYFNDVSDRVAVGDIIIADTSTGGTAETLTYRVNANDGTTVDTTDGVQIGSTTDTD